MNKISILMPTYNDCDTICETLDSLINQTYDNWELVIIDDGSKDDTKLIVEEYKKNNDTNNKIKYIYQKNQDQLLAIINGLKHISGDYIYILHSDDLLFDNNTLMRAALYLDTHPDIDGIIGDLTIIDGESNIKGTQQILPYINKKRIPAIQLLWLGRNLYVDFAFHRSEPFLKKVFNNYLEWDQPFWLNISVDKVSMLNITKVDFSFLKYRIYEGNYANEEVGKLCLIMGEIRTATQLMAHYNIPFYKLQYFFFRVFVHLKIFKLFHPIYQKKETKNKGKVIDFIISKRYPNGYSDNLFLNSLSKFYRKKVNRCIDFDSIYNGEDIYKGNGFRIFNKKLLKNELDKFYIMFMGEMCQGFNEIVVSKKNLGKAETVAKFLCIYPFVKIRSK